MKKLLLLMLLLNATNSFSSEVTTAKSFYSHATELSKDFANNYTQWVGVSDILIISGLGYLGGCYFVIQFIRTMLSGDFEVRCVQELQDSFMSGNQPLVVKKYSIASPKCKALIKQAVTTYVILFAALVLSLYLRTLNDDGI